MKYKLIKEYPGSPKLGYICIKETMNWCECKNYPEFWELVVEYPIDTKVFNSQTNSIYIKKEDGWYKMSDKTTYTDDMITKSNYINIISEKIIEKDYEILSFNITNPNKTKTNTLLIKHSTLKDYFCFQNEQGPYFNLDEILNKSHIFKIHSIKRLSDGEIFTIGDKLNKSYISSILLQQDIIWLMCQGNSINSKLNNAIKVKQPLFTTEDGVDIFEGDNCWIVSKEYNYQFAQYKINNIDIFYIPNKNRYFSTKEKAEEYILLNKPVLSLTEILKIIPKYIDLSKSKYDQLENLVKSKIQQSV